MRFFYLTNSRLPGEKAHAIQIMKTCSALAGQVNLTLFHAWRKNRDFLAKVTDLQAYYGLKNAVNRVTLSSWDVFDWVVKLPKSWQMLGFRFANALQSATYHLSLLGVILRHSPDVWYTRDSTTAALLCAVRPRQKVFYEAHTFPSSASGLRLQGWMAKRLSGLSVLTHLLAQEYQQLGVPAERIRVIPDAAEVSQFNQISQSAARQQLGIAPNEKLAMYVGQMYTWKGVDTLVHAAPLLKGVNVCLVGGTPEELPRVQALAREVRAENVRFAGYVRPEQVPLWLAAADVLVLPNSGQAEISRNHTSPLKLFEYMAAERAIVASDLPSLREILSHEETAYLVAPDSAADLAAGIQRLFDQPSLAHALASQALFAAQTHTWEKRAERILAMVREEN
ncbi:MAG TPA: glycosyltransferase family 4 protein [Anaerolineales bacterium]|nr:glycosyltransferase family 4 protein [Anaerolineales bacterium]